MSTDLFGYRELYDLADRQQWAVQDLDFSRDREDWHERLGDRERALRLRELSVFFCGEERVAAELAPLLLALREHDARLFVCAQIADEARHLVFFDRFFAELELSGAGTLAGRLHETENELNPGFHHLFDDLLHTRIERLAQAPDDLEALAAAVTIYHVVAEGMLALTGQHFMQAQNQTAGTLPGFTQGFGLVARDEHRHVAFGMRLLRDLLREDPTLARTVLRTLAVAAPAGAAVLRPVFEDEPRLFGVPAEEVNAYASRALWRRVRAIGLPVARLAPS